MLAQVTHRTVDADGIELHLLDAGHWALETSLDEIVPLGRAFLAPIAR